MNNRFLSLISTFLLSGLMLSGCIQKIEDPLEIALKKAGINKVELQTAINMLEPEYNAYATFLIQNMPRVDLSSMDHETFVENVQLACKTKNFRWAKNIPDSLFVHYVLPYRVTQEPIERCRQFFLDSI